MNEPTPVSRAVYSALRWSAFARLLTQVVSWTATIFTARLLMPEDYGLVALATLFVGYVLMLGDLGLGAALIQRQDSTAEELATIDTLLLVLGVFAAVLLAAAAPIIATALAEPRIVDLTRFLALQSVLTTASVVPGALLTREMRFKALNLIAVTVGIFAAVVTVTLAYLGFGAWALVIGSTASLALNCGLLRLSCRQRIGWALSRSALAPYFAFSKWVIGQKTLWYWYSQADTFIVGRILGAQVLGSFSMAKQLAFIPADKIMGPLNQIAMPAFASIQHDPEQRARHYLKVLRMSFVYSFAAFWGLGTVAPEVVLLLLGEKWGLAGTIMAALCIALPLRIATSLTSTTVTAIGHPKSAFQFTLLAAVIVPAAVLFASPGGPTLVAYSWATALTAVSLYFMFRSRLLLGVTVVQIIGTIRGSLIGGLAMAAVVLSIKAPLMDGLGGLPGLSVTIAAGAATYLAAIRLVDRTLLREAGDLIARTGLGR